MRLDEDYECFVVFGIRDKQGINYMHYCVLEDRY